MSAVLDDPSARAEHLLREVLGPCRFRHLRTIGYLDLPSRRIPGRTYRLDSLGNLSFREAGESAFNTTLCVQPEEPIPRDDQIAMRYLLVTADEERLLEVANPITFGFVSLIRALYHSFRSQSSVAASALLTLTVVVFLLGSLAAEFWIFFHIMRGHILWGVLGFLVLLVPALVGLLLIVAGGVEIIRAIQTWRARTRLREGIPEG